MGASPRAPQRDGGPPIPVLPEIRIVYPDWVRAAVDWERAYHDVEERMRLAIAVSRHNVEQGTGGPFGAAIVDQQSGRLVAVGMNRVLESRNSALHAEVVAIMMAEGVVGSHSLRASGAAHQLVTSCDPCAMCLGAALWSGVRSLVCGADREDAIGLGFDEGPVFTESYAYLETRGIAVRRGVLREEAAEVLERYRELGGRIYNA